MAKNNRDKLKIAVIVLSLSRGGAERSTAIISKILEDLGHQVTLVSIIDELEFEYGGEYYALGASKNYRTILGRKLSKFLEARKLFSHKNFDLVVDGRSRPTFFKEWIFNKFVFGNLTKVRIIHNSYLPQSFPKSKFLSKYLYKKDIIITVSKKIEEIVKEAYGFEHIKTIYNSTSKEKIDKAASENIIINEQKYILYFGRLENKSKNLFFLLEAYYKSKLPKLDYKLLLVGKGQDEQTLRNRVKALQLENKVVFKKYTPNPMPYVKKAIFSVMTSNFEGFPMTLIESLMLGTPVITLNYTSGPSEIIKTGVNGILVIEKSTKAFSECLNQMVLDTIFYEKCKKGTKTSVIPFEKKYIDKQWKQLLKQL